MTETIYWNGPILTMEEPLYVEALWEKDGFIAGVGSKEELLRQASKKANLVDLAGKALLPSFIDAHSHITAYANTLMTAPLSDTSCFKDIQQRLLAYRQERELPPTAWITGFGYDHNFLTEQAHPTRELLDEVAPQNPVVICHASGHMGVANTAALHQLGIDKNTPDPPGGLIGRDAAGMPNGYLEETAFTNTAARIPPPSWEELAQGLVEAQKKYLSYGVTTVQDGYTRASEWQLLSRFAKEERFVLDVVSYIDLKDHQYLKVEQADFVKQYQKHLKISGYKIFLDGSPQGRTAWLSQPYQNSVDGYCGYPIYSTETVKDFLEQAQRDNLQILAHVNGDAAVDQYMQAYAAAYKTGGKGQRPVLIHAQLLRRDQLPQVAAFNMIVSFFVAHTYYWGDTHWENLGPQRASLISPAHSAIEAGVTVTFHQDTPVLAPNMLETVWCAVNRQSQKGRILGKEEQISPLAALQAVTKNAAYQYFEEQEKGTLAQGKRADMIILSADPLQVEPTAIREIQVLQTIKDGQIVYQREALQAE